MKAEILDRPPISGDFEEHLYDAAGNCTWVKFVGEDTEKVGVFGAGALIESSVTIFNSGKSALVLAKGQAYIIDTHNMQLKYRAWEDEVLTHALPIPETELVAASSFTSVYLFDPAGFVWESDRIASDEVKIIAATQTFVAGTCWQGGKESRFELAIDRFVKTNI
jgi:hypothetical protein